MTSGGKKDTLRGAVRAFAWCLCGLMLGCGSGRGEHGQLWAKPLPARQKSAWELQGEQMHDWDRAAWFSWHSDCGRCTRYVELSLWLRRDGSYAIYEVQQRKLRAFGQASLAQLALLREHLQSQAFQRTAEGPSASSMSPPHFSLRGEGRKVRRLEDQPHEPVIAALRALVGELIAQAELAKED